MNSEVDPLLEIAEPDTLLGTGWHWNLFSRMI